MSEIASIVQAGKDLGLDGDDLKEWVKEQQDDARNKRAEEREVRELEKQKLETEKQNRQEERLLEEKKLETEKQMQEQKLETEKQNRQEERLLEEKKLETEKQNRLLEEKKLELEKQKILNEEKVQAEKLQIERDRLEIERQKLNPKRTVLEKTPLPVFNQQIDKFDTYISRFESIAKLHDWPQEDWTTQLSLLLTGDSLEIFYGLSPEQQKSYEKVKGALLRKFSLTEEDFRKALFGTKVESGESPTQFMSRIERLFHKWTNAAKIPRHTMALKTWCYGKSTLKGVMRI